MSSDPQYLRYMQFIFHFLSILFCYMLYSILGNACLTQSLPPLPLPNPTPVGEQVYQGSTLGFFNQVLYTLVFSLCFFSKYFILCI